MIDRGYERIIVFEDDIRFCISSTTTYVDMKIRRKMILPPFRVKAI